MVFNSEKAREFIISQGIPMSKSKLYKLTSNNGIICHYVGRRLVFYRNELDEWCKQQIYTPKIHRDFQMNIIESAQKKLFK